MLRPPHRPERSVRQLARKIGIAPVTLSRYWRSEVPLKCGPKQLLSWAMHFWALRQRSEAGWDAIASRAGGRAGVERRTLERQGKRLAGCTLSEAWRDPELVRRRFREWVSEVSKVDGPPASPTYLPPVQR